MKYFLVVIFLLTIIYNGLLFYVDSHIHKKDYSNVYNNPHVVWSSRGLYEDSLEQNTLHSFKKAFNEGFLGVEVDCYYSLEENKFIISHAEPKKNMKPTLTLEKLFLELGKGHYFWIDYKNLDRLDEETSLKAIKRLDKITALDNLKERIYLEGSTPNHLQYYAGVGYKTLFAFGPLRENNVFASISSNFYKMIFYFYDMSAVAIQYGSIENPKYGKKAEKNLKGIPVFLFHIPNDTTLLKKLIEKDDVRVMLVGRDKSVNRASFLKSKL